MKKLFYLAIIFTFFQCSSENKMENNNPTEGTSTEEQVSTEQTSSTTDTESETVVESTEANIPNDSSYFKGIINQLSLVEKEAVNNNYYKLYNLLDFKKDVQNAEKLKAMLPGLDDSPDQVAFQVVDSKNGYLTYEYLQVDGQVTHVAWKKSDGNYLIGTENRFCATICNVDVSFQLVENGQKTSIPRDSILPKEDFLVRHMQDYFDRPIDLEDPDFDRRYQLPQKGKDIQFCIGEKCMVLRWMDGYFEQVN